ncbi:MAG: hypothetical protein LUQ07_08780 [Methanospirillum sp.]|nr:hypothetical protein [Methanospirillum sp.]
MDASDAGVIIIVDALSTGSFFVPRLHSLGFRLFHLFSSADLIPLLKEHFEDIRHEYCSQFEEWIEYDGDLEKLHEYLRQNKPVAVISGSVSGTRLTETIAGVLGLPGNRNDLVWVRNNKAGMLQFLTAAGIRTKRHRVVSSLDELIAWAGNHDRWPVMVSRVDPGSENRSRVCFGITGIRTAWREMSGRRRFSGADTNFLVEECAAGTGYMVNTVSYAGKHYLSDFWELRKVMAPRTAPLYDYLRLCAYPSQGLQNEVLTYAFEILKSLGMQNGPAHCEILLEDNKPRIHEFHPMVMPMAPSPGLITDCIGHNQIDWLIESLLDPEAFLRETSHPYHITQYLLEKFLISQKSGKIRDIPLIDLLPDLKSACSVDFFRAIETLELKETTDLDSSPGTVFLRNTDEEELMEDYRMISAMESEQNTLYEMEDGPATVKPGKAGTI